MRMGYPIIIRYRVGLKPSPSKRLPSRGIADEHLPSTARIHRWSLRHGRVLRLIGDKQLVNGIVLSTMLVHLIAHPAHPARDWSRRLIDVNDLLDEHLDAIHRGAEPLERRDVTRITTRYCGWSPSAVPPLSNRAVADMVQQAQKLFNRSLSRTVPAKG
jgi:hypothetical protein